MMTIDSLFLDTTIQITRFCKGYYPDLVPKINRTISESNRIITSTYVLKEFRARVCRDLVYYYNILRKDCRMTYLHYRNVKLSPQRDRRKQMFEDFQGSFWLQVDHKDENGNINDRGDREIAEKIKLWLKSAIEDWWDWFHESFDCISDQTGCIHAKSGAKRVGDTYDCSIRQCDSSNCRIMTFFRDKQLDIEEIVKHLTNLSSNQLTNELKQIKEVFSELLLNLNREFVFNECSKCGDAIIMLEVPKSCIFYTSNKAEAEYLKVPLSLCVKYV